MALTITNLNTLQLLNIINRTSARQSALLTQLSTGKKINTGADNPAGLIALTSLNADLTSVNAALNNNQRTDSMMTVADSALIEVSALLSQIQGLVAASTNAGGLSAAEIATNQSQIDSAITAIDRIIRTTSFNGKNLLDGSLAINYTGVDPTKIENLKIYSRAQTSSAVTVTATITASAQTASASFAGAVFTAAGTNINTSGVTELSITGTLGNAVLTLGSGLTRAGIVTAINTATAQTGVSAVVIGNQIELHSTGFGSDEFISTDVLSGGVLRDNVNNTTSTMTETSRTEGVDASVTINGQQASVEGLDVFFNANGLSFSYSLDEDYGYGRVANRSNTDTFTVELTGGATFQLGTEADHTRTTIGLNALISFKLGGGDSGGLLSDIRGGQSAALTTDVATALKVVKKAIQDVATERGRIGAFQKYQVRPAINSLEANKLGLTNAVSIIGDTDFAWATAELNKQSVLLNSGISLLGLVNQQTALILGLL